MPRKSFPGNALTLFGWFGGCLCAASLSAQSSDSLLRPVEAARLGVELGGPARPGAYVSAAGRRAMAMGTERGDFEVWAWPLKLVHQFDLRFLTPLSSEPVAARDIARQVEVTPAGPVITYTHPAFTVRQRVFAPVDRPAVVMLLDVDAVRPIEILAEFVSDLQLAWPGAIGGQYVFWDQGERAFILSESQRRVNGLVGSPVTTSASNQPAHDVPNAPSQLRIRLGESLSTAMPRPGEPAGKLTPVHVRGIPIVLVGAVASRDSVKAIYRSVLAEIPELYQERAAHARTVLQQSLRIESPDPLLNRALSWAELNLDEALACNPDLGCGLVAGYGPSESRGARPGFAWYFGGDAAINSLGLDATGQFDLARQGLEFFARYQSADGKIPHEISQSAGRIRWFEDFPYAFYHADTTPYWLLAWGDYWKASGDGETIRRLWPAILKGYQWCKGTVDPATGLMLNTKGGLGAVEVGDLGVGVQSDIYLSAVWVEALDRVARMAEGLGRAGGSSPREDRKAVARQVAPLIAEVRALRDKALASLRDRFWLPEQRMYAFALLDGGATRPELTVWPATAMSFGLFDDERGMQGAARQAGASLMTDWGARSLAGASALFDPLHYNNGTVWPFGTGFSALAQYRYRNPVAGFQDLMQLVRSGFTWGLGRNPEVFAGMQYEPLETAVPQQLFGTSFIPTVMVRGLLGWEPDAPGRTIRLAPQLPPEWDTLSIRNAAVGESRYDLSFGRSANELRLSIHRTAGAANAPDTLVYSPHLPPGAILTDVKVLGGPSLPSEAPRETARDLQPQVRLLLAGDIQVLIQFQPGYEVILPTLAPARGDRSRGLRVLDLRRVGDSLAVLMEGPAGSTASFRLRHGTEREVPVTFPEQGDPIDGYSRVEVRVGP
jgi:glycogen debranching enzyme